MKYSYVKCDAIKKDGTRCKNIATFHNMYKRGISLCSLHQKISKAESIKTKAR